MNNINEKSNDIEISLDKKKSEEYSSQFIKIRKPEFGDSGFMETGTSNNHKAIVPFSDNLCKGKGMNSGFFKVPRCLIQDPFWSTIPPKYRLIFITLLEIVCYSPQKFNDHGEVIDLSIGQICITERELVNVMGKGFSKNDVHRAIGFLKKCKKVNHEVNHKKSIITITDPDVCMLIKNQSEPRSEPIVNQSRTRKEESKKDKKVNNNPARGAEFEANASFVDLIQSTGTDDFQSNAKIGKSDNIYFETHKKPKPKASEEANKLLSYFNDSIKTHVPEVVEPSKDANIFDKLLKSYNPEEIKKVITFCHTGWWAQHVHTPGYLNKKFSQLLAALRRESQNNGNQYAKISKRPASEDLGDGKPRFEFVNTLDFSKS